MARGLDHIVHAVRDLDAAAALYRGLGFTVGARNRHPWGTHNHIVQLPGFFIELLTRRRAGQTRRRRLLAFCSAPITATSCRPDEGFSLLILEVARCRGRRDGFPRRRHRRLRGDALRARGQAAGRLGREARLLARLRRAIQAAPQIHFATCQQHYPENFWNPAFQKHANGVTGIAGVVRSPSDRSSIAPSCSFRRRAEIDAHRRRLCHRDAARHHRHDDAGRFRRPLRRCRAGCFTRRTAGGAALYRRRSSRLQSVPEQAGIAGLDARNARDRRPHDAMGAVLVFEAVRR